MYSLPILLPLYTYWKHRRYGGDGEDDEYVSRLRRDSQSHRHEHLVEDLTNGIARDDLRKGQRALHNDGRAGRLIETGELRTIRGRRVGLGVDEKAAAQRAGHND